jgi:hypothetical protein
MARDIAFGVLVFEMSLSSVFRAPKRKSQVPEPICADLLKFGGLTTLPHVKGKSSAAAPLTPNITQGEFHPADELHWPASVRFRTS